MPRLTIQYTVDAEEVEEEVIRLLKKGNFKLSEINCYNIGEDCHVLSPAYIDHIDHIRKKLAQIDHNLNDASNIIDGYLRYRVIKDGEGQHEVAPTEE